FWTSCLLLLLLLSLALSCSSHTSNPGEVGDWRNHFTAEQSQEMDRAFSKQLAGTRLGARLHYQQHCQ
uniref:Sulfotransferase n=1 Tax=Myripristis murdjan TaxID=586833 RepID=A0A667Y381_9TELE